MASAMASAAAGGGTPVVPPAVLQKEQFNEQVDIVALKITPRQCTQFMTRFKSYHLARARFKPIIPAADEPGAKLLLLAEGIGLELAELPAELREFALAEGARPQPHALQLRYEHLTAEQVLRKLLPDGMEVPSAFETIGHVAHLNLREEHAPYKALIGEVLLDKNGPRIRSVVNKLESLSRDGTAGDQKNSSDERAWRFRVFPMEVLAGESSLVTSVRENGARFQLDYREVYWNSRLETEHKRVLDLLPEGSVVADVFAGIGPFAVPAGMRGCAVYANDLNPKSYEYLQVNVAGNKIADRMRTYNLDGRDFVHALLAPAAAASGGGGGSADGEGELPASLPLGYFSNVLMNLPASALTFLDAFVGAFDRRTWRAPLPTVHCYCFSKAADPAADVIAIAERTMGCSLPDAKVHVVRDVAPQKLMLCLSFVVPDSIAWAGDDDERAKRARVE